MSKDCTNRGGTRAGAGRKPKPLAEKIKEGIPASAMPEPPELTGVEMPEIKSYLSDEQRMGELQGKEIFEETYRWVAQHRCEHIRLSSNTPSLWHEPFSLSALHRNTALSLSIQRRGLQFRPRLYPWLRTISNRPTSSGSRYSASCRKTAGSLSRAIPRTI